MVDLEYDELVKEYKTAAMKTIATDSYFKDGFARFFFPALKATIITIAVLLLLNLI